MRQQILTAGAIHKYVDKLQSEIEDYERALKEIKKLHSAEYYFTKKIIQKQRNEKVEELRKYLQTKYIKDNTPEF